MSRTPYGPIRPRSFPFSDLRSAGWRHIYRCLLVSAALTCCVGLVVAAIVGIAMLLQHLVGPEMSKRMVTAFGLVWGVLFSVTLLAEAGPPSDDD